MRTVLSIVLGLCLAVCAATTAAAAAEAAEPAAAPIFSSGMILQRDMPIPVFGTAADGTKVKVAIGEDTAQTVAKDGKWRVNLSPREASNNAVTMTITFTGEGQPKIVRIDNVLVGEVWLCAGQSNMAVLVGSRPKKDLADMPTVRQFGKPRGGRGEPSWMTAEGDSKAMFSATAMYFGDVLHEKLDMPIGLVLTAVSGTPIERWVPDDEFVKNVENKHLAEMLVDREARQKMAQVNKDRRAGKELTAEQQPLLSLIQMGNPGQLYNLHIAPVEPYAMRGVIWYQGEANSKEPDNAERYGTNLSLLISGLRSHFNQSDWPVYVVQLPSIKDHGKTEQRPYQIIRQQQLETIAKTPNTGLAVTIDINEGLHPPSKNIVGARLASLALAETYGMKDDGKPDGGPLLKSVKFEGGKAVCSFTHAEGGLKLEPTDPSLFELAGADGKFYPATATVRGDELVISSEQVAQPQTVRYAYQPWMEKVSLFGSTGIPASPFVYP